MIRALMVAVLALVFATSGAEARHRHHHKHHVRHHHVRVVQKAACADLFCMFGAERYSAVEEAPRVRGRQTVSYEAPTFETVVGRPARYIAGRLICAVNVNAALAERGIRGTGSALALSFLHWGHSAGGPVPGAVIVSSRRGGGHVAIVSRVSNGVVYAWNATGGQSGWREIPYRHHVLDYRVPG